MCHSCYNSFSTCVYIRKQMKQLKGNLSAILNANIALVHCRLLSIIYIYNTYIFHYFYFNVLKISLQPSYTLARVLSSLFHSLISVMQKFLISPYLIYTNKYSDIHPNIHYQRNNKIMKIK